MPYILNKTDYPVANHLDANYFLYITKKGNIIAFS